MSIRKIIVGLLLVASGSCFGMESAQEVAHEPVVSEGAGSWSRQWWNIKFTYPDGTEAELNTGSMVVFFVHKEGVFHERRVSFLESLSFFQHDFTKHAQNGWHLHFRPCKEGEDRLPFSKVIGKRSEAEVELSDLETGGFVELTDEWLESVSVNAGKGFSDGRSTLEQQLTILERCDEYAGMFDTLGGKLESNRSQQDVLKARHQGEVQRLSRNEAALIQIGAISSSPSAFRNKKGLAALAATSVATAGAGAWVYQDELPAAGSSVFKSVRSLRDSGVQAFDWAPPVEGSFLSALASQYVMNPVVGGVAYGAGDALAYRALRGDSVRNATRVSIARKAEWAALASVLCIGVGVYKESPALTLLGSAGTGGSLGVRSGAKRSIKKSIRPGG